MKAHKLIAIAVAVLINVAVFALFNGSNPVASPTSAAHAHTAEIPTLPTIEVYPSASELQELRHEREAAHRRQADASVTCAAASPAVAAPCQADVDG
ncbi:MAG TPA: hypothetical protein VF292_05390 [Rhodanobacteraceae bacterium]